jgi:hypothetical protein
MSVDGCAAWGNARASPHHRHLAGSRLRYFEWPDKSGHWGMMNVLACPPALAREPSLPAQESHVHFGMPVGGIAG